MHKVTKFDEIQGKFVQNWYEYRTDECARQVCACGRFCEIRTKFVRISYEFPTNLRGIILSSHETSCGSFVSAFTVGKMQPPCSPRFSAPTTEQIINTAAPREQEPRRGMCNVQRVGVAEKDVTSIANFASWGGGTSHVLQTPHAALARRAGGGGRQYLYVHIFIYKYVQITFVQVIWDRRSRGQGQSFKPPRGGQLRPA